MLYHNQINQLSVFGSSVCNLSCSYCYLHNKDTQEFYKALNEEIQNGWITGSYVNNIKQVYEKINADHLKTNRFQIWGGEPLIQIDNLLKSLKELLIFLPNVDFFMIPTNFAWPETIAKKIAKIAIDYDDTRNKHNSEFHLQLSIDSYKGILLEQGHHADNQQYLKNIEALVKEISKVNLQNSQIVLDIKATASGQNILKYLSTEEAITDYLDGMFFLLEQGNNIIEKYNCQNKIKFGTMPFFPSCALPENSSVEDGLKFASIVRLTDFIEGKNKYLKNENFKHFFESYSHNIYDTNLLSKNHECSEAGRVVLTILPDGTISECPCSFVQNRQEYLELLLKNKQYEDYRVANIRKKYFFNPITASKEEEEYNDWYNLSGLRNNFSTGISLGIALAQELALSHQIPKFYALNPEYLLRHLTKETQPYSCTREQISDTGIPYLSHPGDYRRVFNGEMEYSSLMIENEKKLMVRNWINDQY